MKGYYCFVKQNRPLNISVYNSPHHDIKYICINNYAKDALSDTQSRTINWSNITFDGAIPL